MELLADSETPSSVSIHIRFEPSSLVSSRLFDFADHDASSFSFSVGDVFLQGVTSVFDVGKSRVGFAVGK